MWLHQAIITGELAAGERLPIEELAEMLEMSPMPIREALRRLDDAGLVDHVPHRGARVRELSIDDLREIYEVRLALEPLAVAHAAERFTDADAEAAGEALARHILAYETGTPQEIFAAHTDFHFALYNAARSRWLVRLITPLWQSSERYRFATPPRYRRRLAERRAEHERILAACVANDPEGAARELRGHLLKTARRVAARMGANGEVLIREMPLELASTPRRPE
jgi:DNA-binding GntR family transcriptional regulator